MHCLVCSSQDITSFETSNDLKQHWYCNNCEVRFLDPTHYLSSDNEKERYEEHNNVIQDEGYRTFLSKVTNPLEKHLQKNDFGLDYGCGHGPALADILKKKGFKIDLYDPYFYPDKTVFKNKYEFITCTEAAEHFYNPLAEFNRMNELLKKNGVLAVMTSLFNNSINFDNWYYRRDPTHVIFYSEKTFHVIAKQRNWSCWVEDKNVIFFKK